MLELPESHCRLELEVLKRASVWRPRIGSRSHLRVLLEW